ncbi:MAG: hypothetical protein SGJ20_11435 [Planctomycetota bacterium]|nr:hypothetical protein [Planctomycetota bacterium]
MHSKFSRAILIGAFAWLSTPMSLTSAEDGASFDLLQSSENAPFFQPMQCIEPMHCASDARNSRHTQQPIAVDLSQLMGGPEQCPVEFMKNKLRMNVFAGTLFDDAASMPPVPMQEQGRFWTEASHPVSYPAYADDDCPGSREMIRKTSHVQPVPAPECDSAVEALRCSSRELDMAAERLEALDLYDQADAIRQTAQELRMKARAVRSDDCIAPQAFVPPTPISHDVGSHPGYGAGYYQAPLPIDEACTAGACSTVKACLKDGACTKAEACSKAEACAKIEACAATSACKSTEACAKVACEKGEACKAGAECAKDGACEKGEACKKGEACEKQDKEASAVSEVEAE